VPYRFGLEYCYTICMCWFDPLLPLYSEICEIVLNSVNSVAYYVFLWCVVGCLRIRIRLRCFELTVGNFGYQNSDLIIRSLKKEIIKGKQDEL
jgi:hypothetical protein